MTSALFELVESRQWQMAITHIRSLADGDAADQLFFESQYGNTVIMMACTKPAPLELYQLMITKAKLDSRKKCLLAIPNRWGATFTLASRNYAALAARVHGGELNFRCLVSPLGFRLLTRVSILICLKRLTAEPNPALDSMVRRAHARLPQDMWSEILSFMQACR